MPYIAIDFVLLAPKNVISKAIKINENILKDTDKKDRKIILSDKNCLPHVSLAMGCLKVKDIPIVIDILKDIIKQFRRIELEITNIDRWTAPNEKIITGFKIKKNKNLQKLHETIMEKLLPYLNYDIRLDMLYQKPAPEKITLYWIKNYQKKSSFRNFSPHITLGVGKYDNTKNKIKDKIKLPIKFSAAKVALCHLGNYCTCRKVLKIIKLSKNI